MRFALALLFTASLWGQSVSALKIATDEDSNPDITANCIRLSYTLTDYGTVDDTTIEGGSSTSLGQTTPASPPCADGDTCYLIMCGATASTKWYYQIAIDEDDITCPVTCTDCGSSDDSLFADDSGLNCDGVGEPFNVTHPAQDATRTPTAPTHSDTDPYDDCASPDGTTQTTPDELVSDFEAVNDDGGVQLLQVDISGGNVLELSSVWTMQALSGGTTRVCIEPYFADADTRPNDDTQVAFGHRDKMLIIRRDSPRWAEKTSGGQMITATDNVTFLDTIFEDNPDFVTGTVFTVTAATSDSSSSTLTITETVPASIVGSGVYLNLPGMTYSTTATVSSRTDNSMTVAKGVNGTDFSGTLSANGTAVWGAVGITSCTTTTPIQCTTATAHGLPEDGTPSSLKTDAVYVGNVNGQTGANGTWVYSVIDADTVELTGSTSVAAFASSPNAFLRYYTVPRSSLVTLSQADGVHFGRCIFGNAWDGSYGATNLLDVQRTSGTVVRDSIFLGANTACIFSPTDDLPLCGSHPTFSFSYIRLDGADDLYIANNLMTGGAGILINAQQGGAGSPIPSVSHLTITGNHFVATDRPFPDAAGNGFFPGNLGLFAPMRHIIELKNSCQFCAITYNYFDGHAVELSNSPVVIWVPDTTSTVSRTEVIRSTNLDISWNYFRNAVTPFSYGTQTLATPVGKNNRSFYKKIRFSNNFIIVDATARRISPSAVGTGTPVNDSTYGYGFVGRIGTQDLIVSNNAWYSMRGGQAEQMIGISAARAPACEVDGNIWTWHGGGSSGFTAFGTTFTPYTATNNLTRFDSWCAGGSFDGNLIIPGVEDPTAVSDDKDSTNTADTKTQAECETAWDLDGTFADVVCVAGDSYSARHAEVFGSDQVQETDYADYGPNMATLRAMVFREIRSISVSQTGPTALKVSWTAPTTDGCKVRLSDDDWATGVSQTDASNSTSQSVTFTGLTEDATYRGWIECPDGKAARWEKALD